MRKPNKLLLPLNRYLVIRPHTEKNETSSGVLLPEDFKPELDKFISAQILAISEDCKPALKEACVSFQKKEINILVDRSMIEQVNFSEEVHHVILENYVLGVIHQSEGPG